MKAKALKKGDKIGVVATSEPITEEKIEDIKKSVKLIEELGLKVEFGKNVYNNPLGYGETAKHKAEDLNEMFKNKEIAGIFCAMGGYNCNAMFDYLDFGIIKQNPKIICGYSDPTSLINVINAKTGLITFHGPNFKTLGDPETNYGYKEMKKRFIEKDLKIGNEKDEYIVIRNGEAEGELVRRESFIIF